LASHENILSSGPFTYSGHCEDSGGGVIRVALRVTISDRWYVGDSAASDEAQLAVPPGIYDVHVNESAKSRTGSTTFDPADYFATSGWHNAVMVTQGIRAAGADCFVAPIVVGDS
jgi:hypothetical protein